MPTAKPNGVPNPRHPNAMFRNRPSGKAALRMLTDVGKHMDDPIPWKARKIMRWRPDCARPAARMKTLRMKVPMRLMDRLPTTSATAPDKRRVQPHVSLCYIVQLEQGLSL